MTTGSDNLGNGAAKTEDRFAGQLGYRPRNSREGVLPGGSQSGGPLSGPLGDPSGDELGPRNGGSSLDRMPAGLDIANPIASTLTQPKLTEHSLSDLREPTLREPSLREPSLREPSLREPSLRESGYRDSGLRESGFASSPLAADPWLDSSAGAVADHPMLRGLLLELPPKGSTLHAQWLDRWFEAARSILELLYRFEDNRG